MARRLIDPDMIAYTIGKLKPDGQLFEIRIEGKPTVSGYFTDADTMIDALRRQNLSGRNVYITLQAIKPECYGRKQKDIFMAAGTTTSDNDIKGYDWLFVDLDPIRPSETASTDEQLELAKKKANEVYVYMKKRNFEDPIIAMSGNGVHLLYKIKLKKSDNTKEIISDCLNALDMLFTDDDVKIDTANFNPSRICKLYGTLAQKGADTPEQPHRMSGIVKMPKELKTTDVGYLKKLAEVFPKQPKDAPKYGYGRNENFRLRDWLVDHNINFRESSAWGNGEKYILDCCPFDSSHKGKDAAVFQSKDGVLGFHCFHDSCSDKRWADFRNLVEPGYKDKYQSESKRIYKQYNRDKPEQSKIVPQENEPVFLSLTQIISRPKIEDTYIQTGITQLDRKVRGLKKGGLTLVSGLRGCGKSTLLSQWMVEAVNDGYNVACYSGELTDRNFAAWMIQQAAGKPFVKPSQWENQYNVPRKWQEVIAQWMDGHFWLYNNKYGNNFVAIMEQLEKVIDEKKIDLLIFDNLMTFDLRGLSDNKYDAQTEFVLKLSSLAKSKNVAICFIAHPRKSDGFLRLQDIAGTADLTNAVDFAFIAHRVDEDFKRLSMQMFGWKEGYDIYNSTNVIEIAKDREFGNIDKFIPMWFEVESRRMKNDPTETKFYGWCKQKEPDEEEFDLGIDDWDDSGETPFD